MPRYPQTNQRISSLPGSVYEKYRARMKAAGPDLVKLHIGDTYLPPAYPLPLTPDFLSAHPDTFKYCNTYGVDPLRRALAEKLVHDNGFDVSRDEVLVTNGATNALSVSVQAVLEYGDEVVVLTPAWPFFVGMVRAAGCKPVEIPFYTTLYEQEDLDIEKVLLGRINEKTSAIYLNTPNNPSGKVLGPAQLENIARVARAHNLWVISDEAYDGMTYDGREHLSIGAMPGMFEQTITVFTFSKIFMVAGFRLGYIVAREGLVHLLNKAMVHQVYSPSTTLQYMMVDAVKMRSSWMKQVNRTYEKLRNSVCDELTVPYYRPEGTYFIFLDTSSVLPGEKYGAFIEDCMKMGVAIAPGLDFGSHFGSYFRLCFTGEPFEKIKRGIAMLNQQLGEGR